MIRPIVLLGDPRLKSLSRSIGPADLRGAPFLTLARDMADTLDRAGGVGLAAPQVGEAVRLVLAGSFPTALHPDRPSVPIAALVDPRIVLASAETEADWEGCLSFLHLRVRVARHTSVTVEYLDPHGRPSRVEAWGFYARVLQHEIDHLDGILTLDRATSPDDVRPAETPPPGS